MTKLVVFGVGNSLKQLEKIINFNNVEIVSYCDNNVDKIGSLYNQKEVIFPSELIRIEFDYLLIAPRGVINRKNIFNQLIALGIKASQIIDFYDYLNPIESKFKILEESTNYETIITGLSYALYGIDTNCFSSKTINLSFESQDLYYDYKILKMVFDKYKKSNQFKHVIMGLCYYSFEYDLSKSKANHDRVLMYYNLFRDLHHYKKDVNDFLIKKNEIFEICKTIFITDFERIVDDLPDNVLTEAQIILNKQLPILDSNKNYPITVAENKSIFVNCMELMKEYNIRPIVVVFPTTKYYYENFSPKLETDFKEIINYYKNVYKFEYYDFFRSDLFNDGDFVDVSHLNKTGAKKMSQILNQVIIDTK